jgi:hypothetical protein
MKVIVFIIAFVIGLLAVAVLSYWSYEPDSPTALRPKPSQTTGTVPHKARPRLSNCVDAASDPKARKQRLERIDQLRKKIGTLGSESWKKRTLTRELEILEIQRELKELEAFDDDFGKTVYREICY